MGASESIRATEEEEDSEEEEDEEEEDAEDDTNRDDNHREIDDGGDMVKKVLEQEPEMLPCYASATPLSPQLSTLGTPRLGPSIKVWDPYNVLAPPPPPPAPFFSRSYSSSSSRCGIVDEDRTFTEVFLISHGECDLNLRPDLVAGRCHTADLTPNGKRQARALAVFLNSSGIRFITVYSSPLSRSRSMAASVCQEMKFADEQIQLVDALTEISLGLWEGCPSSEIYTPEITSLIESSQPDFCAPSGESLRQVEFRMVQFLNGSVIGLPEKLRSDFSPHHQNENHVFSQQWDAVHRHHPRKKSSKSRLQYVTTTGNHEGEDEISPTESNHRNSLHNLSMRSSSASISSCIGVFTHSTPIKCLLTGILGCSPLMSNKICIEDSSVTVLHHSWRTGWQIKRLNDTAHLRLL